MANAGLNPTVRNALDFLNMGTYQAAVLVWFYYLLVPEKAVHLVFAGANVPQSEEPLQIFPLPAANTTWKCSVSGIVNWSVYYTNDSGYHSHHCRCGGTRFYLHYFRHSRTLQVSRSSNPEGQIQPLDLVAFRNLISSAETDYLRQRLPAREFRQVQKERLRSIRCLRGKLRRKTQPSSFKLDNWLKQAPIRERWQLAANSPTTQSYCAAMLTYALFRILLEPLRGPLQRNRICDSATR